ncbi:unnamed protein product [Urochloa humidicola]
MARTKRTAHKSVGGRVRIAPPQPAPPAPSVEEDPEENYFFVEVEDDHIMEVGPDGHLVEPAASPAPTPAPPAPPAQEAPVLPAAPAPDAPAPAATGGDPDDSGDDSDGEDDEDDDDSSNTDSDHNDDQNNDNDNDDDNGNNDNNNGNNNNDNNNGNNDHGNNDNDGNQGGGPQRMRSTSVMHTSMDEPSYFPTLLQDVLWELGNHVKPLYITHQISEPILGDYFVTRVHLRERNGTPRGMKTSSMHDSTTPHGTYAASVSAAAKRALWFLCYEHRLELSVTEYRHLPRRPSGTEQTNVMLGNAGEDRINILARVVAALNTDHDNATTELSYTYHRLQDAHARIAQLEAQLAGQAPPENTIEISCPAESPPRKRLRYGESGSVTGLLG